MLFYFHNRTNFWLRQILKHCYHDLTGDFLHREREFQFLLFISFRLFFQKVLIIFGKIFKTILFRNQPMLFSAFSSCNFLDFSLSTFLTFFQSFLFCHFRFLALELLNSGLISMEIETSIHYVYNSVCTISIWFTFKRLQRQDCSVKNYESLESL